MHIRTVLKTNSSWAGWDWLLDRRRGDKQENDETRRHFHTVEWSSLEGRGGGGGDAHLSPQLSSIKERRRWTEKQSSDVKPALHFGSNGSGGGVRQQTVAGGEKPEQEHGARNSKRRRGEGGEKEGGREGLDANPSAFPRDR